MHKTFAVYGVIFGGLAVILGAFGAHALKAKLSAEYLQVFETGVRYQFYHALALLLLSIFLEKTGSQTMMFSGYFFLAGIFLFSGSIYLLSTRELLGIESWKGILGPVTPLGGLCFIAGWLAFLIGIIKNFK